MIRFIYGLVIGLLLSIGISWAAEFIVDFSPKSVPVLNEELRAIRKTLDDHETRLDDHGI